MESARLELTRRQGTPLSACVDQAVAICSEVGTQLDNVRVPGSAEINGPVWEQRAFSGYKLIGDNKGPFRASFVFEGLKVWCDRHTNPRALVSDVLFALNNRHQFNEVGPGRISDRLREPSTSDAASGDPRLVLASA